MQQLTIFEALVQFDEEKANWVDIADQHQKCVVLAYIPKEALAPTEIPYRIGSDEWDYHYKIWSDYATAIWRQMSSTDSWVKATRILEEYRDSNKPCPMAITRSKRFCRMNDFRPEHVVEYL